MSAEFGSRGQAPRESQKALAVVVSETRTETEATYNQGNIINRLFRRFQDAPLRTQKDKESARFEKRLFRNGSFHFRSMCASSY